MELYSIFVVTYKGKGASLVAQRLKHLPAMWEICVQSLGQEDPLEKEMATSPVFLPGESHGRRSRWATAHGVAKSWTRLSDFIFIREKNLKKMYVCIIESLCCILEA